MSYYMELKWSKEYHRELILHAEQERRAKQLQEQANPGQENLDISLLQTILRRIKRGFYRQKAEFQPKRTIRL